MYFSDLTPYRLVRPYDDNTLTIGWLQSDHEFAKGECSKEFLAQLFELCQRPCALTRGHHTCDLCPPVETREYHLKDGRRIRTDQLVIQQDGIDLFLGNGEIHVPGVSGRSYRAPTLIYHYVLAHNYQPPLEFVEAVLRIGDATHVDTAGNATNVPKR
jgi:hypothetical protein